MWYMEARRGVIAQDSGGRRWGRAGAGGGHPARYPGAAFARLFTFSISRKRSTWPMLRGSSRATRTVRERTGEDLASDVPLEAVNKATAPMFA
jgi:hypothetical protein